MGADSCSEGQGGSSASCRKECGFPSSVPLLNNTAPHPSAAGLCLVLDEGAIQHGGRQEIRKRQSLLLASLFFPSLFEIRGFKLSCHPSSFSSAPRAAVLHAASWSAVMPAESKCLPVGHYTKWLTSATCGSFFPSISLNQFFYRQHFLSANNSHHGGWQDGCFLLCLSFSSFTLIFSHCFSLLFVFFVLTTTAITTIICLCALCPQEIFSPLFPYAISWSFSYFFHSPLWPPASSPLPTTLPALHMLSSPCPVLGHLAPASTTACGR